MRVDRGVGSRTSLRACRSVLAGLVIVVIVACSQPPILIMVHNASASEFYLRVRWDYGEVHVLRSVAGSDGVVVSAQAGHPPATVELLRPDCSVVGSWAGRSGGMISIEAGGSARFGPIPADQPGPPAMDEVAGCGNTQFPAASNSPAAPPGGG